MTAPRRSAYAASGVDVEAGERAVDLMRAAVESTRRPEVVGGLGGFGGAITIPAGCRIAGCALIGGETAEHPGLMDPSGFDIAGSCIGVVERERIVDGSSTRAGDAIIGLA